MGGIVWCFSLMWDGRDGLVPEPFSDASQNEGFFVGINQIRTYLFNSAQMKFIF